MTHSSDPVVAVVDDDKVFQLIASRNIKSTHLTEKILQFNDGSEAIAYLKSHRDDEAALPDILFLDINMPIIDGWMFLDDYADLKPRMKKPIRIYMVSSSIDPKDIERAKGIREVKEYVTKPISADKFADILRAVV